MNLSVIFIHGAIVAFESTIRGERLLVPVLVLRTDGFICGTVAVALGRRSSSGGSETCGHRLLCSRLFERFKSWFGGRWT